MQESMSATFGPTPGLITYYYPPDSLPSRTSDRLAFGFRMSSSQEKQVTLLRVESQTGADFLEVEIINGSVFVSYNMGSQMSVPIGDHFTKVTDGNYHVVKVTRDGAAATLQVDSNDVIRKDPTREEQQWSVFNNQSKIIVGGNGKKPFFRGSISGLVFNGKRVIDLACVQDPFVVKEGNVLLCPTTTRKHEMQSTEGIRTTPHDGVTDDIIVPAGSGEGGIRCPEDDEDDCAQEEFSDNIISTTVKFTYKPTTKPPPKSTDTGPCYSKDLLNCDNQVESTNLMKPDRNSSKSGQLNIEGSKPSTEYNPQRPANSSREQEVTQTPNLALIIGIVGGVLVALIILIIALYKFRSRDEGTYKVDESQNFAFLEKKQQQGNGALLGNHSGGGGKSGKKKDVKEWYV